MMTEDAVATSPGAIERLPAYTAAAVRAAERPLLEAGEPLMARAAAALAAVARDLLGDERGPVLVLAGRGDNGGDALFAAAELAAAGEDVDLLLTSDGAHRDALGAARRAGATCRGLDAATDGAGRYRLIIDGILGIGASRDPGLRGIARAAVAGLLPAVSAPGGPRVLAVDLPSGLHPDDGTADDTVLPAEATVVMGALKPGLVTGRGPGLAGRLHLVDLGLGPALARARPALEAAVEVTHIAA